MLAAHAYGWPWPMPDTEILDRLVALHDVRVAEEAQGIIRWLRPEFQAPTSTVAAPAAELALATDVVATAPVAEPAPWPAQAIEQISALKRLRRANVHVARRLIDDLDVIFPLRSLSDEIARVLDAGYLRGADCWHLATALYLAPDPRELTFVTLDARQREVAETLRFAT